MREVRLRGFWASPTAFTIEEMALDIDRQPISAAASPEVSDALDLLRARETRFRPPRPTKGVPTSGKSGNGPDGRKKQERKP